MIKRKIVGHKYTSTKFEAEEFQIETDYFNEKIYLSAPGDECDPCVVEEFAKTVLKAVEDMKKHIKNEEKQNVS